MLALTDRPRHITVENTTYCNLSCKMCPHEELHVKTGKQNHIQAMILEKIVNQIKPRTLSLTGLGEPLLDPCFFQHVDVVKQGGIRVEVTTNGTLLSEYAAQIVDSGIDILKISIDGARDKTYASIRGQDAFPAVKTGLKHLITEKGKRNSKHPAVSMNFVVQRQNYKEIPEVIGLARQLGVDQVSFLRPTMFETKERSTLVDDIPKCDLLHVLIEGSNIAAKLGVRTNLGEWIHKFEERWRFYMSKQEPFKPTRCMRPWFSPFVAVDGKVYGCPFFGELGVPLGDLSKEDFRCIVRGETYAKEMISFLMKQQTHVYCRGCEYAIDERTLLRYLCARPTVRRSIDLETIGSGSEACEE